MITTGHCEMCGEKRDDLGIGGVCEDCHIDIAADDLDNFLFPEK